MLESILNIDNIYINIFFMSMFPITEERLTIPYFILTTEVFWLNIVFVSMLGNIIIGYIVYFIISPIIIKINNYINKIRTESSLIIFIQRILNSIIFRAQNKGNKINVKGMLGLILFVGIPIPLTGVWTGAFASYLFGLNKKESIIGITLGVVLCAIIVTSLTLVGSGFWESFLERNFDRLNLK